MTFRQKILKLIYPSLMWLTKKAGTRLDNKKNSKPASSIYSLTAISNTGKTISLSEFKGTPMLIVNTASDCGYTNQYEGLQNLFQKTGNNLIVLGFPSNDFKEQEKGTDEEIAQFCKLNYGVTFPIMKKSSVIHSEHQHAIFEWLSNPEKNGWCSQAPTWNFCKYVIDKDGTLTHFYDAKTDPSAILV